MGPRNNLLQALGNVCEIVGTMEYGGSRCQGFVPIYAKRLFYDAVDSSLLNSCADNLESRTSKAVLVADLAHGYNASSLRDSWCMPLWRIQWVNQDVCLSYGLCNRTARPYYNICEANCPCKPLDDVTCWRKQFYGTARPIDHLFCIPCHPFVPDLAQHLPTSRAANDLDGVRAMQNEQRR